MDLDMREEWTTHSCKVCEIEWTDNDTRFINICNDEVCIQLINAVTAKEFSGQQAAREAARKRFAEENDLEYP